MALLTCFLSFISTSNFLKKFQVPWPSAHFIACPVLWQKTQPQLPVKDHTNTDTLAWWNLLFITLDIYGFTTPKGRINAVTIHFHLSQHLKEMSFTMTQSYFNALHRVFFCLINNLTDDDKRCLEIQLPCQWSCFLVIPIMSRCFPALSTARHSQGKQKLSLLYFLLLMVCYS